MNRSLANADAVVFAVRHEPYMELDPKKVVKAIGKPAAIIDAFGILSDEKIKEYLDLSCAVKAMGRGHIPRLRDKK